MMRFSLFLFSILLAFSFNLFSAPPENDQIKDAIAITELIDYCSGDAVYTNMEATSSGYQKGSFWLWDGKRNNTDLPAGVYYYILNGKDVHINAVKKSGSVTLLR